MGVSAPSLRAKRITTLALPRTDDGKFLCYFLSPSTACAEISAPSAPLKALRLPVSAADVQAPIGHWERDALPAQSVRLDHAH